MVALLGGIKRPALPKVPLPDPGGLGRGDFFLEAVPDVEHLNPLVARGNPA
jgi:hypothetical protein